MDPWTVPAPGTTHTADSGEAPPESPTISWSVPGKKSHEFDDPEILAAQVGVLASVIPLYLYGGFVARKLWAWFVLDAFPGAPEITAAQAHGLALVASMFRPTPKLDLSKDETVKQVLTPVATEFAHLSAALLVGSLIKRRLRRS